MTSFTYKDIAIMSMATILMILIVMKDFSVFYEICIKWVGNSN